jgi:hypothetical protein
MKSSVQRAAINVFERRYQVRILISNTTDMMQRICGVLEMEALGAAREIAATASEEHNALM